MKYLFYDIECSDGFHMCSFGYVLTDDCFNILSKEDILMNPEAIFHTGAWGKNREKDPGIELGYPKQEFKKSPKFPAHYRRIRSLIQAEDTTVIGFSHNNDALFLTKACNRYSLPVISYKFYDAQEMYGETHGKVNQVSLNAIADDLGVDITGLVMHRSDDDAEASMLATKALCEKEGMTLSELIEKAPRCKGEVTAEGRCVYYVKEARKLERRMRGSMRSEHMNDTNLREFWRYLSGLTPAPELEQNMTGKRVTLDSYYEFHHYKQVALIAGEVVKHGGSYVRMGTAADIYVVASDHRCARYPHIKRAMEGGKKVEIVSLGDFMEKLGITEENLTNADYPVLPKDASGALKIVRKRSGRRKKRRTSANTNAVQA